MSTQERVGRPTFDEARVTYDTRAHGHGLFDVCCVDIRWNMWQDDSSRTRYVLRHAAPRRFSTTNPSRRKASVMHARREIWTVNETLSVDARRFSSSATSSLPCLRLVCKTARQTVRYRLDSQPASQPASRTQAKARLRPAEERAPNSRRLTCRAQTVDVAASFSLDETRHVSCINVWETAFDKNHNRHISIALFQRPLLTALYEMFL